MTTATSNTLPRELAPGIFWLGQCMEQVWQGAILHNYNSVYLVCGEESSLLVEAGHPQDLPALEAQLESLLARGVAPLTSLVIVDAVIRDLPSTQWGFDSRRRVLFPGDGFAYSHYHQAGMCGSTAEEAPELALEDMTGLFAELALYWTRFTDMEPYIARLEALLARLDVALIAPTHGLPITDRRRTVAAVFEGLRSARPDLDD